MNRENFLHCRPCDVIFRPSPYDRVPEFRLTPDGYTESVRDDCAEFLSRHARHEMQTLRLVDASVVTHDGPLWDPMISTYWQVSNGCDLFVVQGWREHVDEPLRYRMVPGRLIAERVSVEVPERDIRDEVDRAIYPGAVSDRKLDAFVDRFKSAVWDLDPSELEILYDVPNEPSLSVAALPPWVIERVAREAERIFDRHDAARIGQRLAEHDGEPDAFSVLVRRHVRIEQ
jgi:hypothetical protein